MNHRESVPNLKLQFQVIKWNYKRFLDEELLKSSQLVEEEKKFEENNMVSDHKGTIFRIIPGRSKIICLLSDGNLFFKI